ncbi:MAG TPA: hypothetical protein PLB78_14015 [Anaerolineae bacterium]|nr:hypothetical protein [Anaerolineae bacterium]
MCRRYWFALGLVSLVALLLLAAARQPDRALLGQSDEQWAERLAREHMSRVVGAAAIERSRVEVWPSACGWMVVFHDAEARCGDGPFWPGACRFGPAVFRDVYACVLRNGQIQQVGASQSPRSLDAEDRCRCAPDGTGTIAPEPTAAPSMTGSSGWDQHAGGGGSGQYFDPQNRSPSLPPVKTGRSRMAAARL